MTARSTPTNAMERLTEPQIEARLRVEPRLLLAISPLEDHGPGLPVGTGLTIASAVVDEVSRRTGILRAPPFPYGVTHKSAVRRSGLASLRRKTLHRAINELLAGWEDHGIQEFVLVTAHGSESHLDAMLMAMTSNSRTTVFDLGSVQVEEVVTKMDDPDVARLDTALLTFLAPEQLSTIHARPELEAKYTPDKVAGEALFNRYVESLLNHLGFSAEAAADTPAGTADPSGV